MCEKWFPIAAKLSLYVLIGLLLSAAIGKLLDSRGVGVLASALSGDGPLAAFVWVTVEYSMPWLELMVVGMLCGRGTRLCGLGAVICLGVGFAYVALAVPDGVSCGCFGVLGVIEERAAHFAVAVGIVLMGGVALLGELAVRKSGQ